MQVEQAPTQSDSQHTPLTHLPDSHWILELQLAPRGFAFPAHLPILQILPDLQWLSLVQLVRQALVWESQRYSLQSMVPKRASVSRHLPRPSQNLAGVTLVGSDDEHFRAAHSVPAAQWRQLPRPSHLPSRPQVLLGVAVQALPAGGLPPNGTETHWPVLPLTLQLRQELLQDMSQHTPSAQCPLWHWPGMVQGWPLLSMTSLKSGGIGISGGI